MPSYLVSNQTMSDWGAGFHGPILRGSDLYCIQTSQVAAAENAQIWRSVDAGLTWTEQNAANHPLLYTTGNSASAACVTFGDTIRVYHSSVSGMVAITDFDMATNTWGSPDISAESVVATFNFGPGGIVGARRPDGTDVVFFQAPGLWGVTKYVIRSSVGNWGAAVVVADPGYDSVVAGMAMGAGGRCHMVYWSGSSSLFLKTLDATGWLDVQLLVSSSIFQGDGSYSPRPYSRPLVVAGDVYVLYLANVNNWQAKVAIRSAPDADSLTFGAAVFPDASRVPNFGSGGWSWGTLADVGGVPWVLFSGYSPTQSTARFPCPIFASRYVAAAWETAVEIVAPVALNSQLNPSANDVGLGATRIGILYQRTDTGSTHYIAGNINPCPTSAAALYGVA